MKSLSTHQHGFTLIEMIVSLTVFSFVITISIGALLILVSTNKQLQGEQSVMTNLSFAVDAMTREIRTGTFYYCDASSSASGIFNSSNNLDTLLEDTRTTPTQYLYKDCSGGNSSRQAFHGLAFIEGGNSITQNSERILYYFDKQGGKIYRRIGGGASEPIVASGIIIKNLEFFVTGSKKQSLGGSGSLDQPSVTIFIEASDSADPTAKSYYMQTTVTQRILDI